MVDSRLRLIRIWTCLFIAGLLLSGATAIPLERELDVVARFLGIPDGTTPPQTELAAWINQVRVALHEINARYPFVSYGFDWLAFGHFAIAIAFIGALRD